MPKPELLTRDAEPVACAAAGLKYAAALCEHLMRAEGMPGELIEKVQFVRVQVSVARAAIDELPMSA